MARTLDLFRQRPPRYGWITSRPAKPQTPPRPPMPEPVRRAIRDAMRLHRQLDQRMDEAIARDRR